VPITVTFDNYTAGPGTLSYQWNFGDGGVSTEVNPTHNYTSSGQFTVTLITRSNLSCGDTVRKQINVGGYKTDFTTSRVCQGGVTEFTNTSTPQPISSLWVFPDGSTSGELNAKKIFATAGNYQIKLVNDYGTCVDSAIKSINVLGKPIASFTSPDTVRCQAPLTVNFTNSSNAANYQWLFGDGGTSTASAPSHIYTQPGNYSVSLIAVNSDGCSDTLTRPDFIRIQRPVVAFPGFPVRGCIPYQASFNASINSVDAVSSYQWSFGDGTTSTVTNPQHTYTQRGTYDVTLTITTATGCTETYTQQAAVRVGTKPVADFTVAQSDICASERVQFTDRSTPADEITEWLWTFSDGSTSAERHPLHQFRDTGNINTELVVFNNGCPSDPLMKEEVVHVRPPFGRFTYRPNCSKRNEISFTNVSVYDPLLPTTWEWNFGDGSAVFTGRDPAPHTYPTAFGAWRVSLKVTNGNCSFTYTDSVRAADQSPDIIASSVVGCKPFNTTFQATSGVFVATSIWDFGDGNSITTSGPTTPHTFQQTGNFDVRVTVVDSFGCEASRTKNMFIRVNGPTADFESTNNNGCKGMTTSFTDRTTTDGQHPIASWKWNFGDNSTANLTSPPFQHKYDTAGVFDVSLEVKDSYGCSDSIRKPAFVIASGLKAMWEAVQQTCPGSPVQFANKSTGTNFISSWQLGDVHTSADRSPVYAFSDTGVYTIKLKVSDATGCADSLTRNSFLKVGNPQASFEENNLTTFCTPFQAKFQNTSTYYTEKFWDLGIATSRQENPNIYYTATGTYNIRLIVTSPGGCKDTATKELNVFNPGDARFTYGPSLEGCRPVRISFEAFEDMEARFTWDFGDGNVIDTSSNTIEHVYNDFGSFTPRIIMTEPSGVCKISLIGPQVINIYGAEAKFGVNQRLFCDTGLLQINDSTKFHDQSISYKWNYGDGNISTNQKDTSHLYGNPGNYQLMLSVTTAYGCLDTATTNLKVVQSPLISISSDAEICANDRMRHAGVFERSDTSAIQWLWQFPNGNRASTQYPADQQYATAGNYTITAYAVNSSGCADTASQNILVHALPVITVPSVMTMQPGFPITIPATYSSGVNSYTWQPATTLSCSNCPQPVASPKFNTLYTVSAIDTNNCKATSDVQVVVLCKNSNVFVPNTFSPNGDGSNDVFYVRGKGLERVKSLRIFNRWGQIVFEKRDFPVNDASAGWNGTFMGNRPHPDVYIYQVEVFCDNSEIIRFEGNVALIQ
ncbi:MAG TPA: PKD domain-containing protein, partial [Chitinophagaceae bacterium]|nr:PKD domain-containing protein [Chitinophagaceae bacterium]